MPFGVWDAAGIALKAITYAATLGAAGAVFFLHYNAAQISASDRPNIRRIVVGLSILAVLAGAAHIMVSAASMSGDATGMWDGTLLQMVWQAGAGRSNTIRAAGLLLAASLDCAAWPAILGAAAAATSFAWTGHARALNPDTVPVLLLGVHLLAAAFWLGALAPLLLVAHSDDPRRIAEAAARFGAAAVFVVGGLIAAGATLLWMLLGGFAQLWTSTYGRYVMLKLALVGCLLCAAAFNKLRLTPRLRAGDTRAVRSLRTSIRLELLLGILILAVTATFTTLTGPPALD